MLRIAVLAAASLALGLGGVLAQVDGDYPNRPVRLIAAAAPGGNPDVLARLLSLKLSGAFGKAFVVENVPGAGGVVAAKMVAATPPDGHVLMLGDCGAMALLGAPVWAAPDHLASAIAACFLPNQMLSTHQIAASGAATNEMPVSPSPSQVRNV